MKSTNRFNARLAALLAPVAAACSLSLVGCALEEPSDLDIEEGSVEPVGPSGLGVGARGEDVRVVFDYLKRYGYFENEELAEHYPGWYPAVSREPADPSVFDEAIEEGVRLFQTAAGLPVTGVVDAETTKLMKMTRCEMPDFYSPPSMLKEQHQPHYFNNSGSKWSTNSLTYRFDNYTSDMSQANIRTAVTNAMMAWTSASPISFSEVASGEQITLGFYTGSHCGGSAFDGSGGVLAHAYYPGTGDVHFDDAESWSSSTSSGIHLETVAVHELGHSLGLGHSSVSSAVMYAYYSAGRTGLTYDDAAGIWSIYGAYAAQSGCGSIEAGEGLGQEQSVWSCDGRFQLKFQSDGNLVLYMGGNALWGSGTNGDGGDRVFMQEDGNFVMYKSTGQPVWATGTNSTANRYSWLAVQNDGNVVVYKTNGQPVWASGTCCH